MDDPSLIKKMVKNDRDIERLKTRESFVQYNGKTITVGTAPFTTIQSALNAWKGAPVKDCKISLPAGTYTLTSELLISGDLWNSGSMEDMLIEGDTRTLAGMAFAHGAPANNVIANAGNGLITLNGTGGTATLTVTCATTNPNFSADGWGNGDKVYIRTDAGVMGEYTISSVTATVLTLTTNLAGNIGGVANSGAYVILQPNRIISGASGLNAILIFGAKVAMRGIMIKNNGNSSQAGIYGFRSQINLMNCCVSVLSTSAGQTSTRGIIVERSELWITTVNKGIKIGAYGPFSVINFSATKQSMIGIYLYHASFMTGVQIFEAYCAYGLYLDSASSMYATQNQSSDCGTLMQANHSSAIANFSYVFSPGTGFAAFVQSNILAQSTNATIFNAGVAKYSPAASDTFGNNSSVITWS